MITKKILIISPHFPPSNLAAVHRSRLFAQHLPDYGWEPTVLAVDEQFYEEELDYNLLNLLPGKLRVEKVKAFTVTKPRLIGDIGLRGFFHLYKKAKALIKKEGIDFLYVPIPSFYMALLGRWLHETTGIRYGIDYIDPWVHEFKGSDIRFSRHWWSTKLSALLEPIAVKKAVLVTGVAEGYFKGVLLRNPHLNKQAVFAAMPYGGEKNDFDKLQQLNIQPYLFNRKNGFIQLVYAGAMLPNAYKPLEEIFKNISINKEAFRDVEFHFIGTGTSANDEHGFNLKPLAERYGIWKQQIFEYPQRIPYLDVLVHLQAANAIFILGSTEAHYTPSKVYQGVLSKKPILAVLHTDSTACGVIRRSGVGVVLDFNGISSVAEINRRFLEVFEHFRSFSKAYHFDNVNSNEFDRYSAKAVTGILANALNAISPN